MKKETKASSNYPLAQMGSLSGLLRDERGAIAIMVALLLVVVLGVAAMVIDRGELLYAADAGALAGINVSGDSVISGTSMNGAIVSRIGDRIVIPFLDQFAGSDWL